MSHDTRSLVFDDVEKYSPNEHSYRSLGVKENIETLVEPEFISAYYSLLQNITPKPEQAIFVRGRISVSF